MALAPPSSSTTPQSSGVLCCLLLPCVWAILNQPQGTRQKLAVRAELWTLLMFLQAVWYVGMRGNPVGLTVVMGQKHTPQKLRDKGLQTFFLQQVKEGWKVTSAGSAGCDLRSGGPQGIGTHRRSEVVLGTPLLKAIGAR